MCKLLLKLHKSEVITQTGGQNIITPCFATITLSNC
eukprot:CCRYP_000486-RA/>CCRYP_000486-RA protein AED:0.42 eAED:0.42 QI:153/1/1/1/0/0/2/7/35